MRVFGVGHCTLDHFGVVDRFPDAGKDAEMAKFSVQGGGAAATAMVVLARWGVTTQFCGKVGDDHRSKIIEATLAGEGVDTASLVHEAGAVSQFTFVAIEGQTEDTRTLYTRGSVSPLEVGDVEEAPWTEADWIVADGLEPTFQAHLAEEAEAHGAKVLLDASSMDPGHTDLVEAADVLVASERFASRYTGVGQLERLCDELLDAGPQMVVITLGDEGAVGLAREGGEIVRVSALPVDVADTTGAGDVFLGALCFGLTRGWGLERLLRTANATAGMACEGLGARGSIPSLEAVEARLRG